MHRAVSANISEVLGTKVSGHSQRRRLNNAPQRHQLLTPVTPITFVLPYLKKRTLQM